MGDDGKTAQRVTQLEGRLAEIEKLMPKPSPLGGIWSKLVNLNEMNEFSHGNHPIINGLVHFSDLWLNEDFKSLVREVEALKGHRIGWRRGGKKKKAREKQQRLRQVQVVVQIL